MSYTIRQICEADNQVLGTMIRSILSSYGLAVPGTSYYDPHIFDLSGHYLPLAAQNKGNFFVAETEDGNILACGGWQEVSTQPGMAQIQKLYVSPTARGLGIGSALLKHIEHDIQAHRMHTIYLETHHLLKEAVQMYPRRGYSFIETPSWVNHPTMDVFMIKPIICADELNI